MRKVTAVLTATAAVVALAAAAAPAHAATDTTTVALTVVDGELVIVATDAAPAASSTLVNGSRVITAPLGVTEITDTRAASTGWNLTASTTKFTHSLTAGMEIPATAAKFYVQADPVKVLGTVTYTSTKSAGSGQLVKADASGISTTTVIPVLQVDVPTAASTGLYTGTVTQSVV